MKALLSTRSLTIGYGTSSVLARSVDLDFKGGELICLTGSNGSGKSTLLRTLAGLLPPLEGRVLLGGEPVEKLSALARARTLAVVFARFPTGTHLRGYDYVALGRSPYSGWLGRLRERDHAVVADALRLADAERLAASPVDELSDGERQRLSVARALAQEAKVLLLDEPTAFLDLPHRVDLYRMLRELARGRELCVVMSSHELDLALRFADRMVVLDGRGGLAEGVPEALALDGTIGSSFAAPAVRFDLESGGFVVDQAMQRPICCAGEGIEAQWTRRALHRLGYQLQPNGVPSITVAYNEGQCCWKVALSAEDIRYVYNIGAALALLPR